MDLKSYLINLKEYFREGTEAFLPQVSINCVVFKYEHPSLKVLFHNFPGSDRWLLPGGYVRRDESLEEAAYRNLGLSGINKVFLRQIFTIGEATRSFDFRESLSEMPDGIEEILDWSSKRFITVVYYGLVRDTAAEKQTGGLLGWSDWFDVNELHNIALDHKQIASESRKILGSEILSYPVVSSLLPDTFTLNELRGLFEAIPGRKIDRGTFRRKILKLNIVEQTDEKKDARGRPSYLYRFRKKAYLRLLKEDAKFGF